MLGAVVPVGILTVASDHEREFPQPTNWRPITPCTEEEQLLFLLKRHGMHDRPEIPDVHRERDSLLERRRGQLGHNVPNDTVLFMVAVVVLSDLFQLFEVKHGAATNKKLQLFSSKHLLPRR